jgi:hypothetical protein
MPSKASPTCRFFTNQKRDDRVESHDPLSAVELACFQLSSCPQLLFPLESLQLTTKS